jgi:hypothetical protein
MSKAAAAVGNILHKALQGFENIAHGKDSSLFYKMASVLLLISIVGRVTDLITLVYACKFFYCFSILTNYHYSPIVVKNFIVGCNVQCSDDMHFH